MASLSHTCPRCRHGNDVKAHLCAQCGLVFEAHQLPLSLSFWAIVAAAILALQGGAILLSGIVAISSNSQLTILGSIFLLVGVLYLLTAFAIWQERPVGYYVGLALALLAFLSSLTSFDGQASAATWLNLALSGLVIIVLWRECWNLVTNAP